VTQIGEYLTTEQLAEKLGRCKTTLLRWRRARRGPPYQRIEGRVVYDPAKVAEWINKHTIEPR